MEEEQIEQAVTETKENPLSRFIKNNKLSVFLLLLCMLLIVGILVMYSAIKLKESKHVTELQTVQSSYEGKIDSLNTQSNMILTRIFSWSVKGELDRGNLEQANILLNNFVKYNNINQVDLIDVDSKQIVKSTNTKYVGQLIDVSKFPAKDQLLMEVDSSSSLLIQPIVGLDGINAYLQVYFTK